MPRALELRFLSGPHQGAAVPLEPGAALVLGRGDDAELALLDELVSRRHARLVLGPEGLDVEDLGSTNGTFLNGLRVDRARASEGDRILVGGTLLRLAARAAAGAAPGLAAAAPAGADRAAQGRLEDVPVPDLLQLLATARRTGVLTLEREGHVAEVVVDTGRLARCAIDGCAGVSARKSLQRLLAWSSGEYVFRPGVGHGAGEPLEPVLAEGLVQLDDLVRLLERLPARLQAVPGAAGAAEPEDRALLALVVQHGRLQAVLDATPLADLEAAQRIAALLTHGLLAPAGDA